MPAPAPQEPGLAASDDVARLTRALSSFDSAVSITTAVLREAACPGGCHLSPCSPILQMERVRAHTASGQRTESGPPSLQAKALSLLPSDAGTLPHQVAGSRGRGARSLHPQITRLTALQGRISGLHRCSPWRAEESALH